MEPRYRCTACEWKGEQTDLINSGCYGEDRYVEGTECPECWSEVEEIEELEPEEQS